MKQPQVSYLVSEALPETGENQFSSEEHEAYTRESSSDLSKSSETEETPNTKSLEFMRISQRSNESNSEVETVDVGIQVNCDKSSTIILKDKQCQADFDTRRSQKRYKSFRTIRNFYSFLKH